MNKPVIADLPRNPGHGSRVKPGMTNSWNYYCDLWAVQVSSGEKMVAGRKFRQLVVATSGQMAYMQTLHPLDFIRIKTVLASDPQRDPLKQPKDKLQAEVTQALWERCLQHRDAD